MNEHLLIAVLAFGGGAGLTWTVRRLARVWRIVDAPDGDRKTHGMPTPLGGGIAVLGAIVFALVAACLVDSHWREVLTDVQAFIVPVALAAGLLCLLGLVDDRFDIRGWQKLLLQVLIATMLLPSSVLVDRMSLAGFAFDLGIFAVPFTLFFLVGAMNAFNLIDGMDGLAGTVAVIILSAVILLANPMTGNAVDVLLAVALAGALCGFLCFNFPKASIFMGDAGSVPIGFLLGVLALRASTDSAGATHMLPASALLTIPILDAVVAVVRRRLAGRSIYESDSEHVHHALQDRGLSVQQVLLVVGLFTVWTAGASVLSITTGNDVFAIVSVFSVIGVLALTRTFGHTEIGTLIRRFSGGVVAQEAMGIVPPAPQTQNNNHSRKWGNLWSALVESAERLDLCQVRVSTLRNGHGKPFRAMWTNPGNHPSKDCWRLQLPLKSGTYQVGQLELTGRQNGHSVADALDSVVGFLGSLEDQWQDLPDGGRIPTPPERITP